MKIVNIDEMRRIEDATDQEGQSYEAMMDMAGQAVAGLAHQLILLEPEADILVLVGPGNNGGDGLVAARYLLDLGHRVVVYMWKRDIKGDGNFRLLRRRRRQITILWAENDPDYAKLQEEVRHATLVIDALLGTGATRPIEGSLAQLMQAVSEEVARQRSADAASEETLHLGLPRLPILEAMSFGILSAGRDPLSVGQTDIPDGVLGTEADAFLSDTEAWGTTENELDEAYPDDYPFSPWPSPSILAVDCPSGLNCDTGELDLHALDADLTVTFGFPKWGHLQFPGAQACGVLSVADIGIPTDLAEQIRSELLEPGIVQGWLPGRPPTAHKGTFGKALIAAGSSWYTGAAYLSASAAARTGAGLVTLAIPSPLHPILAGQLPEATWLLLANSDGVHCREGARQVLDHLDGYDALLLGPGLTTLFPACEFVQALLDPEDPPSAHWSGRAVVDADALNILAGMAPDLWPKLLPAGSVLTPHPGEMARLTGSTVEETNRRRFDVAREWAMRWAHTVVLKGPFTVIAGPDGRLAVSPFALPTLATAGSGDVLAGAIASLLAQGLSPFEAACCGAYVHGYAGALLLHKMGPAGVIARDIVATLPEALKHLHRGH